MKIAPGPGDVLLTRDLVFFFFYFIQGYEFFYAFFRPFRVVVTSSGPFFAKSFFLVAFTYSFFPGSVCVVVFGGGVEFIILQISSRTLRGPRIPQFNPNPVHPRPGKTNVGKLSVSSVGGKSWENSEQCSRQTINNFLQISPNFLLIVSCKALFTRVTRPLCQL